MLAVTARLRSWELWQLPARAVCYVLAIDALAVGAVGYATAKAHFRPAEVIAFLTFVGCGVLSIHGLRRMKALHPYANTVTKDLLSAWTLPVALLLSPVYALLIPIPLYAFAYARGQRLPPVKRVFNAAAVGLACYGAARTFRFVAGSDAANLLKVLTQPRGLLGVFTAAVASTLISTALVAIVVYLVTYRTTPVNSFLDRENLAIDAADQGTGIVVAVCWAVQPFLILALLPPVFLLQRALRHQDLLKAARTDAKTLLANSVYWREVAGRAVDRASADGRALALMLIDIDHFKRINDVHGHLVGDQVLTAVAHCLADNVRDHDVVGRFGGEEFVVLLPDTDPGVATRAAERLRTRVEALPLPYAAEGEELCVTISIGVVVLDGDARDLDTLLQRADGALYAAKKGGRNQVRSSPDAPPEPALHAT